MKTSILCWGLISVPFTLLSTVASTPFGISSNLASHRPQSAVRTQTETACWEIIRGGSIDDDEERYSRQVYTLGARAHGLVRATTVYVDGPCNSGLLYECVKNLALSGVGRIVIVTSDEEDDSNYYNHQLDDLGQAYTRAACAEIGVDNDQTTSADAIVVEYLHRLNPSLTLSAISRSELANDEGTQGILLCVDRPFTTQTSLNQQSRKRGFAFVSVETAGVYGRIFCDFGDAFEVIDSDGETPFVIPLDHIEFLDEKEGTILVHSVDGERHDVSKGDEIQFQLSSGKLLDTRCSVEQVQTPQRFSIRLKSENPFLNQFVDTVNEEAASFSRVKIPQKVRFLFLDDALREVEENGSLFTPCDLDKSFDDSRRNAIFASFQALSAFVKIENKLPTSTEADIFLSYARDASLDANDIKSSKWENHCKSFSMCCAAKFTPLQAIFGAIAAQEVLKAASGLYNPIRQFLLYDCDEVLDPATDISKSKEEVCSTSGLAYILGKSVEDKLKSKRLFVVGAGAIGCEILKNLSAMGAGTGKRGRVVVTDMDTIERSNLSRQLLFRDGDIGKFKSIAAQEAIRRFNPSLRMEAHSSKVGDEEHGPFDSRFWSKGMDIILNALDNVEARLYMDRQCVANEKAMVDAGTLGSKGNVQVVVPHQSESYGSNTAPPEPAIAVCTLKNFPYAISHTIQWGRDLFDGLFARRAKQANEYAESISTTDVKDFAMKLIHNLGEEAAVDAAVELGEDLASSYEISDVEVARQDALDWAARLAKKLFHDSVVTLLRQHPADSVDEDGEPFWSGSRKVPKPLLFSPSVEEDSQQEVINQNFVDFVKHAARLRLETFIAEAAQDGISLVNDAHAKAALLGIGVSKTGTQQDPVGDDSFSKVCESLRQLSHLKRNGLKIAEFEKDDESNGHVAFVTATSNLRAICYGIPPVDAMETRRVAGRIVPAMITTTAFVSAVSCIELIKLVKETPLNRHRNAFINLALPFFAFTAPLPAEEVPGLRGQCYTLWDRITIKEGKKTAASGGITLRRFITRLKSEVCDDPDSIDISTVSFGQFMIYANFLHEGDNEILSKNLWKVLEDSVVSGNEFDNEFSREGKVAVVSPSVLSSATFLDLTVVVEDAETGEEIELPPVRVLKYTS